MRKPEIMDSRSHRVTTNILRAALAIAILAVLALWGLRGLSLISAALSGIVIFLVSAIGLGIAVAASAPLRAGRARR